MVSGRKRQVKADVLKLVGGKDRKDPVVQAGDVEMPDGLTAAGREAWPAAVAAVRQAGLLSPSFTMGIVLLSEALGDWLDVSQQCEGTPRIRETERGEAVHPLWKLRSQCWERLNRAAKEFGLTGASFGGVRVAVSSGEQRTGIAARGKTIHDWKIG